MAMFGFLARWRAKAAEAEAIRTEREAQIHHDAAVRARNLPEIHDMMLKFEIVFADKYDVLMRQMLSEYRLAWIGRTLAARREVPFAELDFIDQLLECGRVWGESHSPDADGETSLAEFVATGHGDIVMAADLNAATRALAVRTALASPEVYERMATLVLERQVSTADRVKRALEALVPSLDLTNLSA